MADCLSGNTVFAELVDELAGQDVIEKLIDWTVEIRVRALFPSRAPKDSKDLNSGEERAVAVREMRQCCDASRRGFRAMQWNNADWMLPCVWRFFLARFRGHWRLLVRHELNDAAGHEQMGKTKVTSS